MENPVPTKPDNSTVPEGGVRVPRFLKVLSALVLLASIFAGGYLIGKSGFATQVSNTGVVSISREIPEKRQDVDFALFWETWDRLEAQYFNPDEINKADLVYGAIKGMVAAVGDPYTVFLTPSENEITQEDLQGNFEGVGIQIGFRGTQLAVISPLPGTPAERANIEAGDLIVAITDTQKDVDRGTVGITLPEAVRIIRGPAGSKVTLTLLRDGIDEPLVVEVERQSIDVPSVALEFVGEGERVAHLRVLRFGGETVKEWDEAVLDILSRSDLAGVIVDVRGNPGGFLQASIDMASDFVETGDVVVIEDNGGGRMTEFRSERVGRLADRKVVILVDGGSASASEILAGALRDVKGAIVVGETTFGKGTIQEAQQLKGGTGLHITIARWLTPSGFWVNEGGLEPDVQVENDRETPQDEQLDSAVSTLIS